MFINFDKIKGLTIERKKDFPVRFSVQVLSGRGLFDPVSGRIMQR